MKELKLSKMLLVGIIILISTVPLWANNVSVSSVTLTGQNTTDNYTLVQFDLSWENSFRDAINWDACWVFVKYKVTGGDGEWHHATLYTSGYTAPSGSTIDTSSDGKGAFIYRNATGTGTFSLSSVQLRWNYGTDGVADDATVTVGVITIEMVYVPTGNFELGDGNGTLESLYSFHSGTTNSNMTISTALLSDIRVDSSPGDDAQIVNDGIGVDGDGGIDTDDDGDIDNADFPTGYNAFYCMKYEITQEQYVDFLNLLTYSQQATRTAVAPNSEAGTKALTTDEMNYRNRIEIQTSGVASTTPAVYACDFTDGGGYNQANDGQNIACNWLSWADGAAYADWAGLRPMTELEFEKACRGHNQGALLSEYAWGTTTIASSMYTLGSIGASDEGIATNYSTTEGNCIYESTRHWDGSTSGPLRVGIFAANGNNTGRITSGATYYGIMEMSGNLSEQCVTIGNASGRAFTGVHGDGTLDATGNANTSNWPDTSAIGAGFRGGHWNGGSETWHFFSVSARMSAASQSEAYPLFGFRCVRTAP